MSSDYFLSYINIFKEQYKKAIDISKELEKIKIFEKK